MKHAVYLLILSAFFCATAASQVVELDQGTYLFRDNDWFVKSGTHEYKVLTDQMTIKFAPQVNPASYGEILEALGLEEIRHNRLGFYDVKVPEGDLSFQAAHRLGRLEIIEEAFPASLGEYTTDDPTFSSQWNMNNTGSGGGTPDADIDAPEAWAIASGNPAVIVAPLDSGIDYNHNDLGPNIWQNLGEDADNDGSTLIYSGGKWIFDPGDVNGVDDDGNGKKDDFVGWDPESNNNEVMDVMGHGTHVSGIVAARTNNSTNVAGVAGGWGTQPGVRIMMVQVGEWSPNSGILDDSIIYAVDNGAKVITMSLGVSQSSAIDAALDYAYAQGVWVNCSAGNSYGSGLSYPATHNRVVSVSATDRNDNLASFSAIGPEMDIGAPGDDITSTMPGQSTGSMSGTSMSSPHIAGAAGLLLSIAPSLTVDNLYSVLTTTADDLGTPGWDQKFGWGRLNLYQAVLAVADMDMLMPDTFTISGGAGGAVHFALDAGPAYAGRGYYLLASLSGTDPGLPIGSAVLPLNWDFLSDISVTYANSWYFTNSFGTFDGSGQAAATFNAAPLDLRQLIGGFMYFAYILDDPFDLASNPISILVVN